MSFGIANPNVQHWRAGCLKTGTSGSEGGRGKRTRAEYLACGLPYKNLREALEPILDRLSEARQAAADMLADAALARLFLPIRFRMCYTLGLP